MKNNLVSWEQIIISGESPIMEMHFAQLSRDKIIDTINATAHPGAQVPLAGAGKVQDWRHVNYCMDLQNSNSFHLFANRFLGTRC